MAFTSAKMSLRIWNLLTDLYDHSQLADNWAKVDYHDHSPGKGVQIPTEGLADGAVTGDKLAEAIDPTGAYTSIKPLVRMGGQTGVAQAAATLVASSLFGTMTAVPVTASPSVIYLDPANATVAGRTLRYKLRAFLITNAVAPTATYAVSLVPVATWGGGSGSTPTIATIGAAVTGSTTANIVAPTAAGPTAPVDADFDAPVAGYYAIAMVQTGAAAANSVVSLIASLGYSNI